MVALVALGAVILPAVQAQAATGDFHVLCNFSHAAPDDPIVRPGQPGTSHLHDFFGNVSTDAFSTLSSMQAASTSCTFAPDTAGYWVPALISPGGSVVTPNHITAYYVGAHGTITAPPSDLRMVAGGDTSNLKVAGYTCGEGHPTSPVPMNCGGGLDMKGVIEFPSCWDGSNIDSADHRSHMAYPVGGGCPADHPVQIPKIGIHITYGITDGTGYSLSSDMGFGTSNGRSLHADFWNTWNQSTLVQEVAACINANMSCNLGDGAPPNPSPGMPSVQSLNPSSGLAGSSITITGKNLAGTSSVTFSGIAASFVANSDTQLTASVPAGATSGKITVTTPNGSTTSSSDFTVTLSATLHDRRISLVLSGGLLARGTVSVADGFTACAVNVSVKLQRLSARTWRTIGLGSTGPGGRFRLWLRDRTGRYRARIEATSSSSDPCGAATSRVRRHRR